MKQSSLPSSLRPYLYSCPHPSNTLPVPEHDHPHSVHSSVPLPPLPHMRQPLPAHPQNVPSFASLPSHLPNQRYGSPIYSDPQYHASRPRRPYFDQNPTYPPLPQEPSWQEGEAGPSYIQAPYESAESRGRQGTARLETYNFRTDTEVYRGAQSYPASIGESSTQPGHHFYPSWSDPYQSTGSLPSQTPACQQFRLTSANLSHGWSTTGGDHLSGSPSSVSDASSDGRVDNDDEADETYSAIRKGKKRRRASYADDGKKNRNLRKTAVACNFCRGRKLRCDGAKPSCSNCSLRKFKCEYVPVQRRRGPGKAPKGLKSKKSTSRSEPSTSLPPDPETMELSGEMYTFQMTDKPPYGRPRGTQNAPGSDTEKRY